jgi:hypothetical protein
MSPFGAIGKNLAYGGRNWVGHRPALLPLLKFTKFRGQVVDARTDIVIEGFARSGNSFFVVFFQQENPSAQVAHHIHVAGQLRAAVTRRLPAVLLIRDPLQSLSSLLIVDDRLSFGVAFDSFAQFLKGAAAVRDELLVVDFRYAVEQPNRVIEAINRRFGTTFLTGEPLDDARRQRVFDRLTEMHAELRQPEHLVAVPNAAKNARKEAIRERIAAHPQMEEIRAVHAELAAGALQFEEPASGERQHAVP